MKLNSAKRLVWRYLEAIARGDDFDQMFGDDLSMEACSDSELAHILDQARLIIADQILKKIKGGRTIRRTA